MILSKITIFLFSDLFKVKNLKSLSVKQFKQYQKNHQIIDFRKNVGQGIIQNSIWLTSNGRYQVWLPYFIRKGDKFLAISQQGQEKQTILRLKLAGFQSNLAGYNSFKITEWQDKLIKPSFMKGDQIIKLQNRTHLDIRTSQQWKITGIIEGSILISFNELQRKIQQLRNKKNIVINCAHAIRARGGWSILKKHGIDSIILDEPFDQFKKIGFKIIPYC